MRLRKQYNEGGEIASTILQQLGGANRLHAMTGAYNFINIGNGLTFKIKNQRANYIKITLTSMDLYNIEVGRIRGNTYKVVSEAQGLYSDQLKPFIEKATGMYLTLGRGFEKGGMISVNYDGVDLKYKVDTDEKSIEVDEATKKYLSDIVLVMDRDFRKLNNSYIFWYDEMSDEDIKELEEVFQISLTKFAKGGLYATGKTSKKELVEKIKKLRQTKQAQNELKEELKSNISDYEIDLIENTKLPRLSEDENYYRNNLEFLIRKYNIEHGKDLSIPKNLYVFMKAEGFADGGKINEWFEKPYNLREIGKRSPFLIELNNYDCAKNIKNKNSQVEIIKLVNNRISQPISYVLVIKNWASVDELKNIYTECSSHIISYGFTSNEQIAEYRKMDSKMADGGEMSKGYQETEMLNTLNKIESDFKSFEPDVPFLPFYRIPLKEINVDKDNSIITAVFYDESGVEKETGSGEADKYQFDVPYRLGKKGLFYSPQLPFKVLKESYIQDLKNNLKDWASKFNWYPNVELGFNYEDIKGGRIYKFSIKVISIPKIEQKIEKPKPKEEQTWTITYSTENDNTDKVWVYGRNKDEAIENAKDEYWDIKEIISVTKMADGGQLEDDTFVMLFNGYGFVEKRGSYGTRTFYNKEHNAYIYYDPKIRNISGYVGGGEGNDEVIPYSVVGVLDFFIEHDISESEATPLAKGGRLKSNPEDNWHCSECGNPQGRHDMWFEGDLCEKCHQKAEDDALFEEKGYLEVMGSNFRGKIYKEDGGYVLYDKDGYPEDKDLEPFDSLDELMEYFGIENQHLFAKGGQVSNPYEEFLLENGFRKSLEVKKDKYTEYRKGRWYCSINKATKEIEVGKYDFDYSDEDIKKYGGFREDDAPYYHSDKYRNSFTKFKKFLDNYYILDDEMAKGGKVKKKRAKFQDKVDSISERLDGTKVPKRLRKDYGVRYDTDEANLAARRIAGAQLRDYKNKK